MKVAFFLIALLLCVIASSAADLRGDNVHVLSESPCQSKFVNQDGNNPVTVRGTGVNVHGHITVTSVQDDDDEDEDEDDDDGFLSNSRQFWSSDEQGGVKYKVNCDHTLQAETGLCDEIKQAKEEQAVPSPDCVACTGGTLTVTIGENSRTVEMTCDGGVKTFCVKDGNNNCYPISYENAGTARRRRLLQSGYSNC